MIPVGNIESIAETLDKEIEADQCTYRCRRNIVCKSTTAKYFDGFEILRLRMIHVKHTINVDLSNQYEAEGDSFLDHIITGDETWCHHYELESRWQSMDWRREFPIEEKVPRRCPQQVKRCALSFGIGKG